MQYSGQRQGTHMLTYGHGYSQPLLFYVLYSPWHSLLLDFVKSWDAGCVIFLDAIFIDASDEGAALFVLRPHLLPFGLLRGFGDELDPFHLFLLPLASRERVFDEPCKKVRVVCICI